MLTDLAWNHPGAFAVFAIVVGLAALGVYVKVVLQWTRPREPVPQWPPHYWIQVTVDPETHAVLTTAAQRATLSGTSIGSYIAEHRERQLRDVKFQHVRLVPIPRRSPVLFDQDNPRWVD